MWKQYTFADGHIEITRGMSKNELKIEEAKHGKVVAITKAQ